MSTPLETVTRWYHKFSIRNAYGQLVVLIFMPIMVLAAVSSYFVLTETERAALSVQRNDVEAIFTRYIPVAEPLVSLLDSLSGVATSQNILQKMLAEPYVRRIAMVDIDGRVRLAFGYGSGLDWPKIPIERDKFGPIPTAIGNVYGQRVGFASDGPIWLLVDMDRQSLQLAQLRAILWLAVSILTTLMVLLLCLNIYARQWIAPIYGMRIHLQGLTKDNLTRPMQVKSSGELKMLQIDLSRFLHRLHRAFKELKDYTEQTEKDLQSNLDALEMQNIGFRQARDQALKANTAKSAFLANISHELRTPLNSIEGFVNLLIRKGSVSGEQRMYMHTIQKSSAHLLALVNDVLDFSKIEAGKLLLEKAPFNLINAVFDVLDMLSPLVSDKHLKLAVFYYEDVPVSVIGDVLRFKQILTNLVSNAIKFTSDGEINVRVHLEESDDKNCLLYITVQDTGIGLGGISPASLFQSFGQADASVTRQYGGTGLGLSIVKQLSLLMGGEVGASDNQDLQSVRSSKSNIQKGSTFWFKASFGMIRGSEQQWADLQGITVLAYIDHNASLNVLRGYLNRMGVVLEEASSLPDLLGRLSDLTATANSSLTSPWVIVDNDEDTSALLREIRSRYDGDLAVFDYQSKLDPSILTDYAASALYAPINPLQLQRLLQHEKFDEVVPLVNFSPYNLHVLAVDDHHPNLMVLEALLADLGVRVTSVGSGFDAIDLIKHRIESGMPSFDLIFMDIQMPRLSGVEASQKIRALESLWRVNPITPIIALTAHALKDERDQLIQAGLTDYVSKPVSQERLISLVKTWVIDAKKSLTTTVLPVLKTQITQGYVPVLPVEPELFDWKDSLRLSANKSELARDLLIMLTESLDDEALKLKQNQSEGDYAGMAQNIHRLHGATQYTGVPRLREVSGHVNRLLANALKEDCLDDKQTKHDIDHALEALFKVITDMRINQPSMQINWV